MLVGLSPPSFSSAKSRDSPDHPMAEGDRTELAWQEATIKELGDIQTQLAAVAEDVAGGWNPTQQEEVHVWNSQKALGRLLDSPWTGKPQPALGTNSEDILAGWHPRKPVGWFPPLGVAILCF